MDASAGMDANPGADIGASVARLRAALAAAPLSQRYTSGELETVYAFAHAQLARRRFAEALPIFAFLTQYAPTALSYLDGLGCCLQQLGRHDDAIQVYAFIGMLAPEALDASLQLAHCLLAQQRHEAALGLLGLLARHAAAPGAAHPASARAAGLLALLGQPPAGGAAVEKAGCPARGAAELLHE
ncbi:tetratricopeptide repeat protein [Robbsia betulipollinis]|nr:tetratricopeptide repeat protein [Robbsia betulipollinis]